MKLNKNYNYIKVFGLKACWKTTLFLRNILCFFVIIGMTACTDFVEVDAPKNTLISETIFEDAATVESALANIYYQMREQGMVSGNNGLSVLIAAYSDELDYFGFDGSNQELYSHTVTSANTVVLGWWRAAYKLIYAANDILKGLEGTTTLSLEHQEQFKGQALFVRAYLHSLLAAIYGDIPFISTTNYLENNTVARMAVNEVYENIITDLISSVSLMSDDDVTGEHVLPNQSVSKALLARMYLYTEQWALAESVASELINRHSLELDINKVFLKNSSETLWQFKTNGTTHYNTYEANQLVIRFIPGQSYALTNNLLQAFETGDLRYSKWTASKTSSDGLTTLQYANKYKAIFSETTSLEYSIIFRLTEQYLIRAEAKAHLGDVAGAQQDLNAIRNRAGLANTMATTTESLLDAILKERQVELFTEQGHRWIDLKRMHKASDVLSAIKPAWKDSNVLLPIPATELEVNPNLKPQNSGY
ncbi:RagB/SusD family nutrient uptake outer membrane protein [Seonamhaeicola maritimus]|uniref:RagB/SusD family nutrient uptake outer membrane protein n=1 Tax=Seonamhaeicola maritimus TaxID=2591822 RepID=A0A5C7GML5_9FLAO|nr:RagB/SusD family nutrient uptake outer membrane protein [Seonamhaeicola maritimus]TXG39572.1 RagB/SusD family nutrient uptake outer membrane protein [Seonamhaeicola maritimus]